MISLETNARIIRIILDIAAEELTLEITRQELTQHPHFVPYSVFQRIDRKCVGYIRVEDLKNFLM